ncbi:MAG: ABC transporter substrate-binding protein [Betaproteobacteria bacterium]
MSRRTFLQGSSALGVASLLGLPGLAAAEPPPETRKIRLVLAETMCLAPQYIAEEFLRAEGFEQIEYVPIQAASGKYSPIWIPGMLADSIADISMSAAPGLVAAIDRGAQVTVIGGIHAGCYELFGNGDIHTVRDLKGRAIAVAEAGDERLFIGSMMSYVGMNPGTDVRWVVTRSSDDSMRLFTEEKVDAFLGFPPQPQELRSRRIGRMFLSTAADRPWSQYFCCVVAGNRNFVRNNPVATKRVLRALLKAADVCARDPNRAVQYMLDKGYVKDRQYAMGLLADLPYDRWRKADPEDTLRFYALRLREIGMVRNGPQKIIADGTDWRYLNELKRELKA